MGITSVINTDRLYWLGRYSERVFTTLRLFSISFDKLIDEYEDDYHGFCRSLDIPDIYKDKQDFIERYAFDPENPNSIVSNLQRAYDNAIELREEIGSEAFSYVQMAVYEMNAAKTCESPLLRFQKITDAILAFWGCADDQIDDENTRNIIKIGKRVERLDLYARLGEDREAILRELNRLSGRIDHTNLIYRKEDLQHLKDLVNAPVLSYREIIETAEQLVEC
ncbi:MAG: alpha-E domain-containing protein [Lachnospiraceae bacterium]|nr:alpha-E domain-containing protein [Lachnospiraceae bacterium]